MESVIVHKGVNVLKNITEISVNGPILTVNFLKIIVVKMANVLSGAVSVKKDTKENNVKINWLNA